MFTLSVHLGDASAPQKIIHVTTEAGDVRTLTDRHICGATVEQMPHKIQISTLDPIWKATHPLRPPPPISLNSNSPNWSSPRTSWTYLPPNLNAIISIILLDYKWNHCTHRSAHSIGVAPQCRKSACLSPYTSRPGCIRAQTCRLSTLRRNTNGMCRTVGAVIPLVVQKYDWNDSVEIGR